MLGDYKEDENKILNAICLGPKTYSKIKQESKLSTKVIDYILEGLIDNNIIDIEESWINQENLYGLTFYGEGYVRGRFGLDVAVEVYDKDYWAICNYVSRSKNKLDILKSLISEVKSQKDISEDTGLVKSAVSKFINDLSNKGLIVCFNPEVRANKLYGLTEYGAKVCSYVFHIDEDILYLLNDMYFDEHYFEKDFIITINQVKFKIPKGAFIDFCLEDWETLAYMKEEKNIDSFHFGYDSNHISIYVSSNPDGNYTSYEDPFEKNINGIFGIQSKTEKSHVFSYKSEDKLVSIFSDDDTIFPNILIKNQ